MKRILLLLIVLILAVSIGCTCNVTDDTVYFNCFEKIDACAGSDLTIGSDANKTLLLEQPVFDELCTPMAQVKDPGTGVTWASYKGSKLPAFSDTAVNAIYFAAEMPHTYVEGSDVEVHIHIAYPDNGAGDSVWYFTCSWANVDDTFPAPTMSPQVVVASPATTDYHQQAQVLILDGTGKEISSALLCMIQRTGTHGSDTYANVIYLVSCDLTYQVDTMGSRNQFVK